MSADVPSSTAFATSDASARVGSGWRIIDSSICVAVITVRPASRAARIISFCTSGTSADADLDAQVAARHHQRVAGLHHLVQVLERLGLLDLGDDPRAASPAAAIRSRRSCRSSGLRTNDSAT